jgi:mannose/cellobiose epimerase-like protein (N-acyl-D-glucosamine 2-epimerase family)
MADVGEPGSGAADALAFRRQLLDEVIPFWVTHAIDEQFGGYWTHLQRDGGRYSRGDKYLVMQTRMIYSFSIAYRLSGEARHLQLATHGVEFLLDRFRDRQRDGWVWTVSCAGEQLDRAKRPYGLAFAVYALAEYARVAGDTTALELAQRTWDLLSTRAWDAELGGFYHELGEDWTPVTTTKRIDTILHNLEGVSALLAATGDAQYLTHIRRLCDTIVDRTWDARTGCTHEWFYRDWREDLTNTQGLANYGHVAETAWFLASVGAHTGEPRYLELARAELDYALGHGWDADHGGLYSYGRPEGAATDTAKVWWMQSELLDALALFYRLTRQERYADLLRRQAAYIFTRQRDPIFGEWYARCAADGRPLDPRKGFEYKAAYHVVQGLYQADRHLRSARGERADEPGWLEWAL